MPTTADIASNIIAQLTLTEPTLDTSVGSITRKIIDAVAGAVAEQSTDNHLIRYTYDIDSKNGADLTDFVRLFGLDRLQAGRASGTVTFSRSTAVAATMLASIPMGSAQVSTTADPPQVFSPTMTAAMALGQVSVDVPVQAITSGPTGNVTAGTLTQLSGDLPGVEQVTNTQPCIGGTNEETDDALRARFKATVFRNMAGTADMYRAMALQTKSDPADDSSLPCTAANVVGPRMTYKEQIAIASDGTATSSIPDAAFIYASSVFLGANISQGLTQNQGPDQAYTVAIDNTITTAPNHPRATLKITSTGGASALVPGSVWDLQFDYVSMFSRNDPFGTRWSSGSQAAYISTRVDIWCNGIVPRSFTQTCVFSTNVGLTFTTDTNHQGNMDPTRYRLLNGGQPISGDYFMPLLAGPILAIPSTLKDKNGVTLTEGIDYDIVHMSDAFGYSPTSKFGIVWHKTAPAKQPAAGSAFTFTYTYNVVPTLVQQNLESQWRLLGTDAQVHGGVAKYYRFHLAVVYLPGFSAVSVNLDINTAVMNLVNSLGFRSGLQVSDVLQAVHNVTGVDNVRFLTSTDDPVNYAIQPLFPDPLYDPVHPVAGHTAPAVTGTPISQVGGRAADVYFDDASYPLFDPAMLTAEGWGQVRIITKARNTFGVS